MSVMKQYSVMLPLELWEDFVKAVPDHGVRAILVRAFIRRLVQLHKKGYQWDAETVRYIWEGGRKDGNP
ncbi:MAG: hypothetical protein N3E40_00185 [Dehalococcoidia bacterium]|nr:hypothetical protein [Dehalococcoidia bacterium]